ncbi:hypothetical protein ABT126_29365 [Streptomyces sp. NPDC002012]|uniref:hypothetical protein n=1 Tax=Streptomyces sp. NPDC002012 TaxID=3154532 RepID=UPI0033336B75
MDLTITVRGCDQCKRNDRPATRYTLTIENGEQVTRDLCAEDAAPLEAVFGPLPQAEELSPTDAFKEQILTLLNEHEEEATARRAQREAEGREANPAPAKTAAVKKAPAKKATSARKTTAAKKAAAKKAPAKQSGTKSMTVAQIEALKAKGKQ